MSALTIEFQNGGVHLPKLKLWLDPHDPKTGAERVFVSHAHTDHLGAHREVILSAPTARLMNARLVGQRLEHVLPFHEPHQFEGEGDSYQMTLLPAGHIFGSAMCLLEVAGESLLYTGDFKLRRSLSAELCEPRHADILIMETTYGRPQYQFPPTEDVMRGIIRFCQETLDNDETAVLLGYSLGKSQELLCGLAEAGLPIVLHGAVYKLTQIYEQFGQCFPKYERYVSGLARRKVLLCPPNVANSAMVRNLGRVRSAILTGWAVEPNCRFRYQADAAFPLSDHADFPDLIDMVKQVSPRKVYTLHGFAADFAQTLRELGSDAQALSESEQMVLALEVGSSKFNVQGSKLRREEKTVGPADLSPSASKFEVPASAGLVPREPSDAGPPEGGTPNETFQRFAETCLAIAGTRSKLQKVRFLADYLATLEADNLRRVTTWFTGLPFISSQNKVLQLGGALLSDALCVVGEVNESEFHQVYLKHSDLGETAFEILQGQSGSTPVLSIEAVDRLFEQIRVARGPSTKLPLLVRVLQQCSPLEAKFLVKTITSDLRIGLKEGLVEEAIARAFDVSAEAVRRVNLLLGNIGETAELARKKTLESASLAPFRPVKFMLASPEETAAGIWERMVCRDAGSAPPNPPPTPPWRGPAFGASFPSWEGTGVGSLRAGSWRDESRQATVWVEDKYDGIRCQLHKVGPRVSLYSRDLKDITSTFPDLADAASSFSADVILDGEILAMRGDNVLPFSVLQRRLGRREGDLFMADEIPVKFIAFDLLWLGGVDQINRPLQERRAALESLAPFPESCRLARITQARSVEEIESAFAAARERSNEGLIIKDPASLYSPGRRGLAWLKLKKAYATLDCVVVGAEYGHGKRKDVLSDYTFAVRDDLTGELKTIGKAYSGLTDVEIAELTKHFLSTAVRQRGRYYEVEPTVVLEIAFDRIQPSPRHTSGLALRFPRIVRIRTDKTPQDIDTLATARRLVDKAAHSEQMDNLRAS